MISKIKYEIGDRVRTKETRDSYEHNATIIALRDHPRRNIGLKIDGDDSDIPWWYGSSEIDLIEENKS